MTRRKSHAPLKVLINGRITGRLEKETSGAIRFKYDDSWLGWAHRFPISLSLQLRHTAYQGTPVAAVFDNLLPDNPNIRRRVAERTGAQGTDAYSLLEQIGRDCVGAMQFLPEEMEARNGDIQGESIDDDEIERLLANLGGVPLGIDPEHEFRISIAGAQEKTALLHYDGKWMRPIGTTPTTHILKPQLGEIPTSTGVIDMAASVDNEHYCLKLMEAFGLTVASTSIATFGERRVLVVERFDRQRTSDSRILRQPQEDCCQALGIPPSRKYQSTVEGHQNGPSAVDILTLLRGSDEPTRDRVDFFKSQILFWLIGATDGHGKNFSIFLRPGGGYELTPFYDVLSAQLAFDNKQIPNNRYKLAMSVGASRKYRILDITGRHFVQTGKEAGLGPTPIRGAITEILDTAQSALTEAREQMPRDFFEPVHNSVSRALEGRLATLMLAFDEL
ncbi:toxin-antitoxin system toxin component HipA [Sphingomonas changbaiensis NBRC 104936]|uniref:Toxin-antitoxin system toxin component HipA n=1 Tax=Sphingomonas changbaiensis NBRC 104936 TaxID=1219043 RepID=A0A0E9MK17_9SPHN|nr:type II toxin-antitoxin system HipA family toxin [Sphingomonas changbaiensis]GAO37869.1 toxin-antitoxin system toxin component HipA [Sphingomonas changbaiensis NBRC 104936]